jgi:hypothetical protein
VLPGSSQGAAAALNPQQWNLGAMLVEKDPQARIAVQARNRPLSQVWAKREVDLDSRRAARSEG